MHCLVGSCAAQPSSRVLRWPPGWSFCSVSRHTFSPSHDWRPVCVIPSPIRKLLAEPRSSPQPRRPSPATHNTLGSAPSDQTHRAACVTKAHTRHRPQKHTMRGSGAPFSRSSKTTQQSWVAHSRADIAVSTSAASRHWEFKQLVTMLTQALVTGLCPRLQCSRCARTGLWPRKTFVLLLNISERVSLPWSACAAAAKGLPPATCDTSGRPLLSSPACCAPFDTNTEKHLLVRVVLFSTDGGSAGQMARLARLDTDPTTRSLVGGRLTSILSVEGGRECVTFEGPGGLPQPGPEATAGV